MKEEMKDKPACELKFCIYANTPGCRVHGLGVEGITKCVKYAPKEDKKPKEDKNE